MTSEMCHSFSGSVGRINQK